MHITESLINNLEAGMREHDLKEGLSVSDQLKCEVLARLMHNLTLEQLENLEQTATQNFKVNNKTYLKF